MVNALDVSQQLGQVWSLDHVGSYTLSKCFDVVGQGFISPTLALHVERCWAKICCWVDFFPTVWFNATVLEEMITMKCNISELCMNH